MLADIQAAKDVALAFQRALDQAAPGVETEAALSSALSVDHVYRGVCPFYEMQGAEALAQSLWTPLKQAMPVLQRRPDIFFASRDHLVPEAPIWVVSMGHFLGDFMSEWLGIPAIGKASYLPYVTFHRVSDGKITETVEYFDLLAILSQAGLNPYAEHQTGGHLMVPGPKTHDGLLYEEQNAARSAKTHQVTTDMLSDLAKSYTSPKAHMETFWHPDMNWFGPTGIGSSLGFPGYRRGHTDPFEDKLDVTEIVDWELATAEGDYSAVMWWPCLRMRNAGGYMGVPPNDAVADMRVVDLYRRDGDKLAENWIFIDMLHFLKMQGIDLLSDIKG